MFSSVGWVELAIIFVVALLVIGPERLPGLIKELRAVMLAIRNAVGEARQQLDGEFGDEIREFSKPLAELNNVRQMGARGFITKTLFDGDESYVNSFDETKNQFRDTVESVRQPSLRDTFRSAPSGNSSSAGEGDITGDRGSALPENNQPQQHGGSPVVKGGVEVTQQAVAGESRSQLNAGEESPVRQAAENLAARPADNNPAAQPATNNLAAQSAATTPAAAAQPNTDNKTKSQPTSTGNNAGAWDDVI